MTKPDAPFRHWDIYVKIRIAIIAAAILMILYTAYRLF
jgi:hypothetical protein